MGIINAQLNTVTARSRFQPGSKVLFGQPGEVPDPENPATLKVPFIDKELTLPASPVQGIDSDSKFEQSSDGNLYGEGQYSIRLIDRAGTTVYYLPSVDVTPIADGDFGTAAYADIATTAEAIAGTAGVLPDAEQVQQLYKPVYRSLASMKAAVGLTAGQTVYLSAGGSSGDFERVDGDFTVEVAADPLEGVFVKLDGVPASEGVLRRVLNGPAIFEMFGAVGDGITDNTDAIQACLDTCESVLIGVGRYKTSPFDTGVCKTLHGSGDSSVLVFTDNSDLITVSTYDLDMSSFVIEGDYPRDKTGTGPASTKTKQTAIRDAGYFGFRMDNVRGYKLGGWLYHASGFAADSSKTRRNCMITDCSAQQCNGGLFFDTRGEYHTVVGGVYEENNIGVRVGAGNVIFSGCNINHNGNNVELIAGINDGHGIFSGCNINHADTWAILATDVENGMTFSGCHIYDGDIFLNNSKGIDIKNGDIDVSRFYFKGSTGLISNNFMPGYYGSTINNNYEGVPSLMRWFNNHNAEGQRFGYYTPYDGGYVKATLSSSESISSDQVLVFQNSVSRMTNNLDFQYYELYNNTSGLFTYRGIGYGMVNVQCQVNAQSVADPSTTSVWLRVNGADYIRATADVVGSNVYYTINSSVPIDSIGDTMSIYVKTSDAGGVSVSTVGTYCQIEGL